jgi:molecular chaperone GrpE (heat shock protein)
MDEGPQVNLTGRDAATGADTGTDAEEPGAGAIGDATATQPDHTDLPDQPYEPDQPDQPPVADAAADAASSAAAPPTQEFAPDALPPAEPRTDTPAPEGSLPVTELAGILAALSALGGRVDDVASATAELSRLRSRDTDLIARLHEDVTTLRTGEIAAALNPVVTGMIKLHDQMVSLGALDDPASPVGMLRTQLLQIMELTCAVKPFTPAPGEPFDASRHTGARRVPTTDASADGTIASTIKAGFVRADGSVVRVAEVEVHRQ